MGREEQIINERLKKIKELKEKGINPYPERFEKKNDIKECLKARIKSKIKTAGRLITKRELGKIAFCRIKDFSGEIQIVFQKDETPAKYFDFFKKYIDAGDFVGIEGDIIKTKTGEISILVKKIELLSKSILPLPEKWHGVQNEEERLRKRYLDILMNEEVKKMVEKRGIFWNSIRKFLLEKDFIEVETPVLENTTGGADAKPFVTHHNALDIDVYLRISCGELWQKRLMVAGFEKIFEIGRIFRNEGMSHEHLQDYSQMEFYWAYANYNDAMQLVEEMYKKITKDVLGSYKFKSRGHEVDMNKKWPRIKYADEIKKQMGINIFVTDEKQIKKKLKELKINFEEFLDKPRLIDLLWKECRKNISGPCFIIDPPVELSPLAKRNLKNPAVAERFWVLIAGSELGNGYSELNDPLDQEERFKTQEKMREKGDEEAQMYDKEFVEALKHGMPPTAGFGLSERFFSYLMDKPARETQIFPLMKPEEK
jgi:lysyl-tRNA synthetase class 2